MTCKAVYFKEFMNQNMSQRTMLRFRLWYKFSNNNPIDTTNFTKKKKNVQFKIAYVSSLYRINQYLEIGNWVDSCKDEFKVKWRILWQRCSLFPQSLYKTAIVKASPSNICRELFQWIGQFCIFPILVKSISKYFLSIDFIDTICSQKLLTN